MWQIILIQIGKGILSAVGSKILDSLMKGKRRQVDFALLIAQALKEFSDDIKQSIKDVVESAEYRESMNSVKAAQRAIRQYNISPKTRQDLLDEITFHLSTAITSMETIGPRGLNGYMFCVSLEVVVLQERQKIFGGNEHKIAVCDTIRSALIHWMNVRDELKD